MTTATTIHVGGTSTSVSCPSRFITDWADRYFSPWWATGPANTDTRPSGGAAPRRVVARVDPVRLTDIEREVHSAGPAEADYAGGPMLHHIDRDGTVLAVQPGLRLGYQYDPASGELLVVGTEEQRLAVAAARLAREILRGQLMADGWRILHASAVVRDGRALLALGGKGSGKSTTALLLGREGYQLLANDRLFVRQGPDGELRLLPWPAAAAIGLGLLSALGLFDAVRDRVVAGESLHPTQHPSVTAALRAGDPQPIWQKGKELKAQFFPDQLPWLGLTLTTGARAAGLLFPSIDPTMEPATRPTARTLSDADFFTSTTDDRYPDIFGITTARPRVTTVSPAQLAQLPCRSVTLNHDPAASTKVLATTAEALLAHS